MRCLSFIAILIFLAGRPFAQSPHGKSIGELDCSSCHQSTTWKVEMNKIEFDHNLTNFKLVGQHNIVNCRSCHISLVFSDAKTDCYSCHTDIHQNTVGFSCERCHTPETWIVKNIKLVHQQSRFPLVGVHQSIDCTRCHSGYNNLNFQPIGASCYSCHSNDFTNARNPNHITSGFSTDCETCHSIDSKFWTAQNFQHDFFPLTGGHKIDNCFACHKQGTFAGLSKVCISCHLSNYNSTTNPIHGALGLSTDCQSCHTTNPGWQPASFTVHNNYFTLAGIHSSLPCSQCHKGNYLPSSLPNDCYSCHTNDYNNTTNPNHQSAQFPHDCQTCHTQLVWSPSTFNHDGQYFPIYSGSHNNRWTLCSQCHQSSTNFAFFTCMSSGCHPQTSTVNEHNGVQGFVYAAADCYACHPQGSGGGFNHAASNFPLTGAHISVDCIQCHQNGYTNIPKTCVSCHQNNYNTAANPNHKFLALSTDCSTCHTTVAGWQPATFAIHSNYFPLVGAHAAIATCLNCHNGNYNNTPSQCSGCHLVAYNLSQNPKHQIAGISTVCQSCHNTVAWIPSTFSHTTTGFALTGVHLTLQCSSCHVGTTSGLNSLCVSCHQSNYNTAANHLAQSYPTTCEMCHNTSDWTQSTFNHQTTPFPLTGAHITVLCGSCHQTGFIGTPTACASCHQTNYNNTTNPSHTSLQLAVTCETCHTTNPGWQPAAFPIHNNYYTLAGAHTSLICTQCHNGNYLPTSVATDCFTCHTTDYNNTTNPNHQAAQFPHDCQTCHTQSVWSPSTFNHDGQYFPIYSGSHNNRWTLCSQCHQSPTNFALFTCMSSGCHPQTSTDSNHNGISGYVYTASACYNCHPRGNGGGKIRVQHLRIYN
ncbi:MAG: hypothetical protein P4L35_05750 [Ignavibacteriaceae bacterium]|nr:hypothetical protein [Ignavibacteriaceae bacterium]